MRFAYRLALACGRADVYTMLGEISATELVEWQAFAQLEPFGGLIDDVRFAQWMALFANANRNPKKSRRFRPKQFSMAAWPSAQRRANWGAIKAWAQAHNARIEA